MFQLVCVGYTICTIRGFISFNKTFILKIMTKFQTPIVTPKAQVVQLKSMWPLKIPNCDDSKSRCDNSTDDNKTHKLEL